jgi:3-hydroxybutyryl-CoA dehydrogenase
MPQIQRVLIVGAGWVGRQVAAKIAASGIDVALVDRSLDVVQEAIEWISQCTKADDPLNLHASESHQQDAIQKSANNPKPDWIKRVIALAPLAELTGESLAEWQPDLALECVSEQLSLKKRVLRRLSELVSDDCIIASNSSYFVPSVLCKFVERPERFAHLHFHVPVLRETVADIVGCQETNSQVLQSLAEFSQRIGQYPLMLRHEHPGYVFNWLLQAVLKAALELVANDVVDAADVDRSWKSVTGMPLGPFGMMDQIGIDVIDQVLSNARWAPPLSVSDQQLLDVIRPLIQQGKLGVKSGSGFYDYRG